MRGRGLYLLKIIGDSLVTRSARILIRTPELEISIRMLWVDGNRLFKVFSAITKRAVVSRAPQLGLTDIRHPKLELDVCPLRRDLFSTPEHGPRIHPPFGFA